jgi:eight-cysteine-cluster-containing protein
MLSRFHAMLVVCFFIGIGIGLAMFFGLSWMNASQAKNLAVGIGNDTQNAAQNGTQSGMQNATQLLPKSEFCGTSTNESCGSGTDCVAGGCSGQICQSKNNVDFVTTCEWRNCYNVKSYGLNCACVDSMCQWA